MELYCCELRCTQRCWKLKKHEWMAHHSPQWAHSSGSTFLLDTFGALDLKRAHLCPSNHPACAEPLWQPWRLMQLWGPGSGSWSHLRISSGGWNEHGHLKEKAAKPKDSKLQIPEAGMIEKLGPGSNWCRNENHFSRWPSYKSLTQLDGELTVPRVPRGFVLQKHRTSISWPAASVLWSRQSSDSKRMCSSVRKAQGRLWSEEPNKPLLLAGCEMSFGSY